MTTLVESIVTSNLKTNPEYRIVCQGLEINVNGNDLVILACVKRSERIIGDSFASWHVLVERDPNKHRDPFVVWRLIARPEGWHLESGTYCATFDEGWKAFGDRDAAGAFQRFMGYEGVEAEVQ